MEALLQGGSVVHFCDGWFFHFSGVLVVGVFLRLGDGVWGLDVEARFITFWLCGTSCEEEC